MTDKIIIDGVDVSGCEWYQGAGMDADYCHRELNPCNVKWSHERLCNSYPNCYYKQLQRKIQECETKQKALEIQKGFLDDSDFQIQTLKAENKELKKTTITLAEGLNIRQAKCDHYKQTLEAIKGMCNKRDYLDYSELLDDILNIINEVKDEKIHS